MEKECEVCGAPLIINSGRTSAGGRNYFHLKRDEFAWMVFGQIVGILGAVILFCMGFTFGLIFLLKISGLSYLIK